MIDDRAPDGDAELLIRLAAATISPREETGLDVEEESLLLSLEHADWLGAIVSAVRDGPGADASPDALVDGTRNCPEVVTESGIDFDEESHLEAAFWIIALPWQPDDPRTRGISSGSGRSALMHQITHRRRRVMASGALLYGPVRLMFVC